LSLDLSLCALRDALCAMRLALSAALQCYALLSVALLCFALLCAKQKQQNKTQDTKCKCKKQNQNQNQNHNRNESNRSVKCTRTHKPTVQCALHAKPQHCAIIGIVSIVSIVIAGYYYGVL
jgi:hypothetical protein